MSEWISVKDELPKDMNEVLVWEKWASYPFVGYYGGKPIRWIVSKDFVSGDVHDEVSQKYVTHWMPLPQPPKEDN